MAKLRITLVSLAICGCFFSAKPIEAKRLTDLPDDILELFFEHLNLPDLLSIIDSDKTFLRPATWAFRHTHAQKMIEISGKSFNFGKKIKSLYHYGREKWTVYTWSYEMTLKMLQFFGKTIQKLHINYISMNSSEVIEINRLIRENCADQLKYLEITFDRVNRTEDLIASKFPQVDRVTFTHGNIDFGIDLNEVFPAMRTLEFRNVQFISRDVIDRHFPHLNEFKMNIDMENWQTIEILEPIFENAIKKNPQIKHISVSGCSEPFLTILHNSLPQIESLDLNHLDGRVFTRSSRSYHYENMEKFTMHVTSQLIAKPDKIPFTFGNRLKEVKLFWPCDQLTDQWRGFLENNTNIQKVSVTFIRHVASLNGECTEFAHLMTVNLPNLRELKVNDIDLIFEDETEYFLRQIDQRDSLNVINLVNIKRNQIDVLQRRLSTIWQMEVFESDKSDDMIDVLIRRDLFET